MLGGREKAWAAASSAVEPVRLVAVVNSFNRRTLLESSMMSLRSALRQLPFPAAIVIFDAGSTDGSIKWLREFQSNCLELAVDILVADQAQDSSFAAGVNAASRHGSLKYPEVEFFLMFETDNLISESGPIEIGVKLLTSRTDLGAVGFAVTKRNGDPAGFGCSFPSNLQFLLGQQLTSLLRLDRPRVKSEGTFYGYSWGTCDVVYTSPLLVKRATWDETHGLDALAFPFSDCDLDWCWRAIKCSWKTGVIEIKGVVHDNDQQLSAWSSKRVIAFHRGRYRLLRRHIESAGAWLLIGLFMRHSIEFVALGLLSPFLSNPRGSLRKRWLLITSVMRGYRR